MGWFANIFIVFGLWFIGNKKRFAFVFTFIGETIWTIYSFSIGMYDLAAVCALFAMLAARNWLKWRAV